MIKLSCPSFVYDSCDTVITLDIHILLHWGQLRLYKLRRWWHEVCGIYEGFLIWIIPSMLQSHESKVWACITSFVQTCIYCITIYLITCLYVPVLMTHFHVHVFLSVHATWLHFTYSLVAFWQPWTCMLRSLNCSRHLSWSLTHQSAQRKCGGSMSDHPHLFPSRLLLIHSQYPFCCSEASIVLFALVNLIVNHTFISLGDVIFMLYCITLCDNNVYYFIGMYNIIILLYFDSCLYWCLAYICEGISALRIYVAVTSSYSRDRGVTWWYQSLGSQTFSTTSRQINVILICNWDARVLVIHSNDKCEFIHFLLEIHSWTPNPSVLSLFSSFLSSFRPTQYGKMG